MTKDIRQTKVLKHNKDWVRRIPLIAGDGHMCSERVSNAFSISVTGPVTCINNLVKSHKRVKKSDTNAKQSVVICHTYIL